MQIYGKEYGFRFTVGASIEIAKLCPGGKLENLGAVMEKADAEAISFVAKMAVAMNKGYRIAKSFEAGVPVSDFSLVGPELTEEMVLSMDMEQLSQLNAELLSMQKKDSKTTVQTAPSKKKAEKPLQKSG